MFLGYTRPVYLISFSDPPCIDHPSPVAAGCCRCPHPHSLGFKPYRYISLLRVSRFLLFVCYFALFFFFCLKFGYVLLPAVVLPTLALGLATVPV